MKIESYYKFFLMTPVSHLPVVGEDGTAIGLLSRDKISREMADLDSTGIEYESIPEHLMSFEITDTIIKYFQSHRTIPVINTFAQRVDTWEKPRFLAECSDLLKKKTQPKTEVIQEKTEPVAESANKMLIYKFMELILRNFPDALFSTDKDGNTTFYNEKFETNILSKNIFRDSITIAEKYFKELNRDLISEYLKSIDIEESGTINVPVLQAYVNNLNMVVKVVTLKGEEKIIGFLYHLIEQDVELQKKSMESEEFPSIRSAFDSGTYLNDILREVEYNYILKSFKKNNDNISHTASSLGIPRSTLQNRIKYLGLGEKLGRDPQIPIPRARKESRKQSNTDHLVEDDDLTQEEDEFIEDPHVSQAKKLKKIDPYSDIINEEKSSSEYSKKNSVTKRKSSSQMNSKKK